MADELVRPGYEFLGTALLLLRGNGVVCNVKLPETKGRDSGWIVITFGWGMAVFVAVWCVMPVSGAHINPAVTLALAAVGRFAWAEVPGYLVAQLLGAMAGATAAYLVYRDHYERCDDGDAQLLTFCNMPAIPNAWNNLVTEAVGTFVLVLAILSASTPSMTQDPATTAATLDLGPLGALHLGLLVFAIGLCLGGPTGYAINPARDLGPRIVHALLPLSHKRDSGWAYAWIPVVGPVAGGLLAAAAAVALGMQG